MIKYVSFSRILLIVSLAISSARASIELAEMKDGTGASVLVYHDQTINDSTVRLVLKRIGELRAYAVKLRGERNIIKSLSDAQVRSDVISKLSAWIAIPKESPRFPYYYDLAVGADLKRKQMDPIDTIRRIYIFDYGFAISRMHNGQALPYLEYKAQKDEVVWKWTSPVSGDPNEPTDMPIVLTLKDSALSKYDSQIKALSAYYGHLIDTVGKADYRAHAFFVIHGFVYSMLSDSFPPMPTWFQRGVADTFTIYILGDLIGRKNATSAFEEYCPLQTLKRDHSLSDLEQWDGVASNEINMLYEHLSTKIIVDSLGARNPEVLSKFFSQLKKMRTSGPISSQYIFAEFKRCGITPEGKPDLPAMLLTELVRNSR